MTLTGPHRALVYVQDGRWRLIVAPPPTEGPQRVLATAPDPVRQVVARDLGSAEYSFAPASFGHRLIENGFIIDPAERAKPDTVSGWSQTDAPDRWQTVCYATSEVVG
jgi:hypothetical protein